MDYTKSSMKYLKAILFASFVVVLIPVLFFLYVLVSEFFDGYTPPNVACKVDSDCNYKLCKNMGRFKPCDRDGEPRCNNSTNKCECFMTCM